MSIGSVNLNSPNFTSNATTKHGNEYNRTSSGKLLGFGVGAGIVAEKVMSKGGWENFVKSAYENMKLIVSDQTKTSVKELTPEFQRIANFRLLRTTIGIILGGFAVGAVFDGIINTVRKNQANK